MCFVKLAAISSLSGVRGRFFIFYDGKNLLLRHSLSTRSLVSHLFLKFRLIFCQFWWVSIGSDGFWMSSGGFRWVSMGSGGFWWVSMGFDGFWMSSGGVWWVSMGSDGFWWVLMGFDGFWWVLVGFDGFRWVLNEFWWGLMGFDGFWWVLVGFDGWYRH